MFIASLIVIPIAYNVVMSFQNVDLMNFARGERLFVGFGNYSNIFRTDVFGTALRNTLVFTFWCLIFQFPLGFAMALYFGKSFPGSGFMRGICLIAWMLPMVSVAGVFKFMFNGDVGIINNILLRLHLVGETIPWLSKQDTAMTAIVVANIWKGIPFNMILLATALTTLPADIYEAASIDGASPVQKFFLITVPLLKPAILSVLTLGFIYTFKVFDLVYVMTGGGPGSSTEMLSTLAYRYSFNEYNFSEGAAVSNVLFVILMCVGIFYINLVQREDR
ncbi:MAG: sugar ABC transporter permease [Treponemataceae bacterium]